MAKLVVIMDNNSTLTHITHLSIAAVDREICTAIEKKLETIVLFAGDEILRLKTAKISSYVIVKD